MKVSKKEQNMILALAFVGIAATYYQFGYTNLSNVLNEKIQSKTEIEEKYNKAKYTIETLEDQKSKVKKLNAKIDDEANSIYPTISQEHIVLELDKLLKENGLEGGITFEKTEVAAIEAIKKSEKDKELGQSSVQKIVDEFNSKYGLKKTEADSSSKNKSTTAADSGKTTTDKKTSGEITVEQLNVIVDFSGTYESVNKFLNSIGNYKRKISVCALNMSQKNIDDLKGSIGLVIYSVPKIDDDLNTYLKWNLNNTYGKLRPFDIAGAVGTGIKSDIASSDFMVQVKPVASELPSIVMGKTDDKSRSTYAYGDGNSVQEAEIILSEKDNKYYYKYKTSMASIPANYGDLGNEFTPVGENIQIKMSSESRVNSEDKSGLKLKVTNNTKKLVQVEISGDDQKDPRITIDGDSKNVSVSKK